MNKEEIKCITKEQLNQLEWSDTHEYGTTLAYELIERIDKAIGILNWVKEVKDKFTLYNKNEKDYIDKLLEILKGDSNE